MCLFANKSFVKKRRVFLCCHSVNSHFFHHNYELLCAWSWNGARSDWQWLAVTGSICELLIFYHEVIPQTLIEQNCWKVDELTAAWREMFQNPEMYSNSLRFETKLFRHSWHRQQSLWTKFVVVRFWLGHQNHQWDLVQTWDHTSSSRWEGNYWTFSVLVSQCWFSYSRGGICWQTIRYRCHLHVRVCYQKMWLLSFVLLMCCRRGKNDFRLLVFVLLLDVFWCCGYS